MSSSPNHYEVLGVDPGAPSGELRAAYRRLVRRYHPDRHRHDEDRTDGADDRIREVNAAWWVLRDADRRADYDRSLGIGVTEPGWSPFPAGTETEPEGGFEEWYADAELRRRQARLADRTRRPERPPRIRLWFGLGIILIVGIVLITELAGSTTPAPPGAATPGACVRIGEGPSSDIVPCRQANDGRVLRLVTTPGACPAGSTARRLNRGDTYLACLGSATG